MVTSEVREGGAGVRIALDLLLRVHKTAQYAELKSRPPTLSPHGAGDRRLSIRGLS